MKQLLINEQPTNIYLDDTNVYNATTIMEEPIKPPVMKHAFEASW